MGHELTAVLEAVRHGEIVRVAGGAGAREPISFDAPGHLILAAQRVSADRLNQLLQWSDGPPVFAITRDRLEQLHIAYSPLNDEEGEFEDAWLHKRAFDSGQMVARLERAARSLAGDDSAAAAAAFDDLAPGDFRIRCADWAGVLSCERAFEAGTDLSRLAGLAPVALVCRIRASRVSSDPLALRQLGALPTVSIRDLVDHRRARVTSPLVRNGSPVRLPTRHGNFSLQGYEDVLTGQMHLALWIGNLESPTLTRVHSECLTGDLLGSLRCDCGFQLDRALERLTQEGSGVLLYLRQEGRGIGLSNKLRTYTLQDRGFDTVEANEQMGFQADLRDYSVAALILVDLGVSTIRLLTNNPQKVRGLKKNGIRVADRVPLVVEPCSENLAYLDAKRTKLGHFL
jgi:3,4-dihydroxy 2-butanone 4-phosphate synthase / GTP cyclohydrolase II